MRKRMKFMWVNEPKYDLKYLWHALSDEKNLGEFLLLSYSLDIKMSDGTTSFCLTRTTTATTTETKKEKI